MHSKESVILLHGLFHGRCHMRKLDAYLTREGYEVLNIGYPARKWSLEELARRVYQQTELYFTQEAPLHFVGYSMGGLLVRAILNQYRPACLGRVVQLAAPNKGSEVADFVKNSWLFKTLCGPAGQQLITNPEATQHLFGPIDYELGGIAGNRSRSPISSRIINEENDGKVSVESTRVEGMKEHLIIKATHTGVPFNKHVHRHTHYFLKHGTFQQQKEPVLQESH
tara:strand:+ start:5245 stop:5919 length:675 start_codon:yes stop_codon:yes gene_type:complete